MENLSEEKQSELDIIAECTINERTFVITADKKIFERDKNNQYKECSENDKETEFLKKYIKPPKSLDIDMEDYR